MAERVTCKQLNDDVQSGDEYELKNPDLPARELYDAKLASHQINGWTLVSQDVFTFHSFKLYPDGNVKRKDRFFTYYLV